MLSLQAHNRPLSPVLFRVGFERRLKALLSKLPQPKTVLVGEQFFHLGPGSADGSVATLIIHAKQHGPFRSLPR